MGWNVNNDLINGDNLNLYLTSGKTVVAYATSCSLAVEQESIDASSKFACRWNDVIAGKASYTISADALYCNADSGISFDGLLELMVEGENVDWYMGKETAWTGTCAENPHTLDTTGKYYSGKAQVQSVNMEASNNAIATCSIQLQGSGEITVHN